MAGIGAGLALSRGLNTIIVGALLLSLVSAVAAAIPGVACLQSGTDDGSAVRIGEVFPADARSDVGQLGAIFPYHVLR